MAENPHPKGSPEWQQWINDKVAGHDARQEDEDEVSDVDLRRIAAEELREQKQRNQGC